MPDYTCPKCDAGVRFRHKHQVPRQIKCPSCRHRFPARGNDGNPHGLPGMHEHHVDYSGGSISFKMVGIMILVLSIIVMVIVLLSQFQR